jgi:hypothetical protein
MMTFHYQPLQQEVASLTEQVCAAGANCCGLLIDADGPTWNNQQTTKSCATQRICCSIQPTVNKQHIQTAHTGNT